MSIEHRKLKWVKHPDTLDTICCTPSDSCGYRLLVSYQNKAVRATVEWHNESEPIILYDGDDIVQAVREASLWSAQFSTEN